MKNYYLLKMAIWGGVVLKNNLIINYNIKKVIYVINNILNDDRSKNLYLSAISLWISKYKGLFISLYYDHIWKYYDKLEAAKVDTFITVDNEKLFLYDLSKINFANIKIYYSQFGIFSNYFLEQYAYCNKIKAQNGDFVIDCGACYGDSAIYFANNVGENGKVFAFEFVDKNIEIFNKNIALNPHLNNIHLIQNPVSNISNEKVSFSGSGGAAKVEKISNNNKTYKTISIDDFVKQNKLTRLDFIKMDIEGSELNALKGAKQTLQKFNPKIAICLYHSYSDYYEIPIFLKDLLPHYEFYFDHFTLNCYESVLFGIPE